MKKRLMAALLALLALIPATIRAEVTESVAQSIFTEVTPKQPKARKVTDGFWYVAPQGGIVSTDYGIYPQLTAVLGYKHRIGRSCLMYGGQITIGHDLLSDGHGSGFIADFAPTISYMRFPGGFYNSFEATLGLGFGYRKNPGEGFAFTPELNLTYWFNWFGIGATIRESFQKSGLKESPWQILYPGIPSIHYDDVPGNQFSAMLRLVARF